MNPIEKFRNYILLKQSPIQSVIFPLVRKRFKPIDLKKFVSVQPMKENDENSETK